jgi:hypothetical protein
MSKGVHSIFFIAFPEYTSRRPKNLRYTNILYAMLPIITAAATSEYYKKVRAGALDTKMRREPARLRAGSW